MKIDEQVWTFFHNHLGYSDEEMIKFKENPRNQEVISKGLELTNKTIVAEVVHSHGCNSQHKLGDKFYLDGAGNLISKLCPKRMCLYAVSALNPLVFSVNELLYAGKNPNEILFKRCGCSDVGLQCGGWGRVVMEVSVVDRVDQ
ncbi:MAG: TIGR04076 family protein [Desulfomonile tiedjei]|uniref:TIGR04076 family protein n=1 Tax=Desulfomonile tiedjei TaxID=2358 RepID=A0A9D6V8N6_9BACT|nr:TIGR04076 family protein [Desulfomonile tiedjei]